MNEHFVIMDARGLLMHSLYSGNDVDAILGKDDKRINRAAHGFQNWLDRYILPILEDTPPTHILAVYDGGKDYRKAVFPKYKANREKAKREDPNGELKAQQIDNLQEMAKRFLAYLGGINICVEGVEADDVIGLLCTALKDYPKIVHTVDVDIAVLTDEQTCIFLRQEPVIDEHKDVPTRFISLQKSLVGDPSDNYGGVKGFGEATWTDLFSLIDEEALETLEMCVATRNFKDLKESVAETGGKLQKILTKIYDARKDWALMYDLARLHPELCYGFRQRKKIQPIFHKRLPNAAKLQQVLAMAGCMDMFEHFEPFMPTETLVTADNVDEVFEVMDGLIPQSVIVPFDYESYDELQHKPFQQAYTGKGTYVDVLSQVPTGASFCLGNNLQHTFYFSCGHKDTNNLPRDMISAVLEEVQDNLGISLVAHNAAFEEQLSKQGFSFQLKEPYDTLIMSSYVDENREAGLKALSWEQLRYKQDSYAETLAKAGAANMAEISGEDVLHYGCDDSLVTGHLFMLFRLIMLVEGSWEFYCRENRKPVHLLNRAKERGIEIDWEQMYKLQKKDKETIAKNMRAIRSALSEHCNEPNEEAAAAFYKADLDATSAKIKDKLQKRGAYSRDKLRAELEAHRLRLIESSRYVPYAEIKPDVEFIGTPAQLRKVAAALGLESEGFSLEKTTIKFLNEYLTRSIEEEIVESLPESQQQKAHDFLARLGLAAGKELKNRTGDNWVILEALCKPILTEMGKVEKAGDELNFNSPVQSAHFLYLKLGFPVRERTMSQRGSFRDTHGLLGSPSSNEEAVTMAIAEDCPIGDWRREVLQHMLEVKSCDTRESLYYSKYPLWKHPKTGCLHPGIRDCGTATRRPTGSNPNLLQISKGDMRTIFVPTIIVPKNEYCVVAVDFSGQELRIMGSESKDPTIIEAYTGGGTWVDEYGMTRQSFKDLHSVTACSFVAGWIERELGKDALGAIKLVDGFMDYDEFKALHDANGTVLDQLKNDRAYDLTPVAKRVAQSRRAAKSVNFLIAYCGTAYTLAKKLGVPEKEAQKIIDMVFAMYSRLGPWQNETIKEAWTTGYIETAYGNRKHVPEDIRSRNYSLRGRAERQTVNFKIQSTAADILHIVETAIVDTRLMEETQSGLLAPVYDEIVSYVPVRKAFEFSQRIQDIMNITPPGHVIPMMAEVSVGWNWGQVIELGDRPAEEKILKALEADKKGKQAVAVA